MRKLTVTLLLFLLVSLVPLWTQGQALPRDYAIINPRVIFSADNRTFNLEFIVRNSGGSATDNAFIEVISLLDDSTLSQDPLAPIAAGQSVTVTIPFDAASFVEGVLPLQVRVGLDDAEPPPFSDNNTVNLSVTIPRGVGAPAPISPTGQIPPAQLPAGASTPQDAWAIVQSFANELIGRDITGEEILLGGIIVLVAILGLWLFSLILRLLFRREPSFDAWQPPYAMMPMLDNNTAEGRRQAWQTYAQNNLLLAPPTPNNIHAIKQLVGIEGENLTNWRIEGLRLSQYDNYGRVAKSQVLADKRTINALNGLLKRRIKLTPEKLSASVMPIAKRVVKPLRRKLNAQNAFLPIALDLRLKGKQGEVRIVFELYQFNGVAWMRLDQWEPSIPMITRILQENLTYTVHGITGGERLKDFTTRLNDDVAWLLTETLRLRLAQAKQQPTTAPQYDIPDTLRGVNPIV